MVRCTTVHPRLGQCILEQGHYPKTPHKPPNMRHTCHAQGCTLEVPPSMLMCRKHWWMVPKDIQRRVWLHYVAGQEVRKDPTQAYLDVMREAIAEVAMREGKVGRWDDE